MITFRTNSHATNNSALNTATAKYPNKINISRSSALSLSLIMMACFPALADDQPLKNTDKSQLYAANFFSQYTPQNALEMIDRLPGFSFDQGSNARGFGGNAGNVLIDGERPTSKSGGLRGALVRIPAAQVSHIEILSGGVSEASGQAIVANVVRIKSGTSGTWALKIRQTAGANPEPNLEAALSTAIGQWDTSFDTDIGGSPGYRGATIEYRDANGELTSSAAETMVERSRWAFFNGEGGREFEQGKLTLNARIGFDRWRGVPKRSVFDGQMPDQSRPDSLETISDRSQSNIGELGVDWVTTSTDWKWHVLGLGQFDNNRFSDDSFGADSNGSNAYHRYFTQDNAETELIARATMTKVGDSSFTPEFGVEVASNTLDSTLDFIDNGETIELGNANVVIKERRAEIFATLGYTATTKLNFEGGITTEFSRMALTGGNDKTQQFQFYKPRLSATYQMDDSQRLTVELEHRVGQLDFGNFAASINTENNVSDAGNSDLRPDQTSEIATTYDWGFSERGSLKVKMYHQWRKDIIEHIKLSDDPASHSYGIGNAGDARFWGLETELNLPLDFILPHGLLEFTHNYRASAFRDPIINRNRTINDYTPNWYTFTLRQDLTDQKLAWGVTYWAHYEDTNYRVNEIQTFGGNNRTRFFIETTHFTDLKVYFEVSNSNTAQYTSSRFIYNNPDRSGGFVGSEVSRRTRKPDFKLSISGSY